MAKKTYSESDSGSMVDYGKSIGAHPQRPATPKKKFNAKSYNSTFKKVFLRGSSANNPVIKVK